MDHRIVPYIYIYIAHTKTTVVTLFLYPAVVNRYRVAAGHTCNVHLSVRENNHSVIARGCKFCYITSLFHVVKMLMTLQLEIRLLAEGSALDGKKNHFLVLLYCVCVCVCVLLFLL